VADIKGGRQGGNKKKRGAGASEGVAHLLMRFQIRQRKIEEGGGPKGTKRVTSFRGGPRDV